MPSELNLHVPEKKHQELDAIALKQDIENKNKRNEYDRCWESKNVLHENFRPTPEQEEKGLGVYNTAKLDTNLHFKEILDQLANQGKRYLNQP